MLLVLLTALEVSGTSSGALYAYLFGGTADPHLLLGQARGIRSDEWLVNTPMGVAQAAAGFPQVNDAIGSGQSMSIVLDVPYRDWSLLFKPQNWLFGVLPLGAAFAWKWWFLAAILALAIYGLVLQQLPHARWAAAFTATGVVLSPFVQWWNLSSTLGSLAWSAAALFFFVRVMRAETTRARIIGSLALWFCSSCFALVLYPPFQLPCLLVVVAAALGIVVTRLSRGPRRALVAPLLASSAAVLAAGAVAAAFLLTRLDAVELVRGTAYPGERVVPPGGFSLVRLLYGSFAAPLQLPRIGNSVGQPALGGNASEASAFLLPGLFLSIIAIALLLRGRRERRPVNGLLVGLLLVTGLFAAHLFLPFATALSRVSLLTLVPLNRLHIGLGLLATLLSIAIAAEVRRQGRPSSRVLVAGVAAFSAGAVVVVGLQIQLINPTATVSPYYVVLAAAIMAALVGLLGEGRLTAGAGLLAAVSVASSLAINPVYRGVVDVRQTPIGRAMAQLDGRSPGGWVSLGGIVSNAVMVESGVHTFSAVFSYPDPTMWRLLDPTGRLNSTYNRYGHVVFQQELEGEPIQNPQPDVVLVRFDACAGFAQQEVKHVLAVSPVTSPCLRLAQDVPMPGQNFYLYEVVAAGSAAEL